MEKLAVFRKEKPVAPISSNYQVEFNNNDTIVKLIPAIVPCTTTCHHTPYAVLRALNCAR